MEDLEKHPNYWWNGLLFFPKIHNEYLNCFIRGFFVGLALLILNKYVFRDADYGDNGFYLYFILAMVNRDDIARKKSLPDNLTPLKVMIKIILSLIPLALFLIYLSHSSNLFLLLVLHGIAISIAIGLGLYCFDRGKSFPRSKQYIIAIGIVVLSSIFFAVLRSAFSAFLGP